MKKRNKKTKGDVCYLSELGVCEKAVVERLEIKNKFLKRRLIEMGITNGVLVEIKKIAPLGDPVGIIVRGYELCVRKTDLKSILARVVWWK